MERDLSQFIIKRKRKKYKFALFANSSICFELDEWHPRKIDVLELGAGTGLFSVEMATRHPDKQFMAVDVKADRLQKGAHEATERRLKNIYFVRSRADQMHALIAPHSLQSLWLTFPDPFPKKRATGRRMTHPYFLKQYKNLLVAHGSLYLKHDNRDFFAWSLEQLVADKWHIEELSFDLHESDMSDDSKIITTYEKRWIDEGLSIQYVRASRENAVALRRGSDG